MLHQIKTLIWRNFRLKKRSSISSFIEIGIPILIIIIIGFNSEYNDKIININEINNKKALSIDDINNLPGYQKVQFQFDFIFPNDYNLKDTFLLNFQNNELFKNFKILQKQENFSNFEVDLQNLYLDYEERVKINPNNITKFEPYTVNFYNNNQRNYEMKINVLNNEQELYSQYHAKINFFQYGIKFISPTEKSYILDYDYYDPIQTASIIQMCIDKAIIKTVSNKFNDVSIKVETKPMDQQKFSLEYSVNSMKSYIPFLMIVYFIPYICNLLNYLVIEKETKIKNSLIIIGLRKSNIWISWAIVYGVIIIVSSILGSHFIYNFDIFLFIKQRIIICILIFFGLSCCSLSFIFSTFISNSKMGNIVSIFLSIFLFASYFLQEIILENSSYWIKNLCYFTISPISFFSFFKSINHLEDQRQLVTFSTILEDPDLKLNFFGLIASFFIYFTLAIYLDNVLPQGSNLHRPWHFPITDLFRCCIIKKFNSRNKNINSFALLKEQNPYIEDDSAITKNASVRIENIQKTFKGKSDDFVLNEISFNAYKNEIFAILGHNGAGKSTLLNIMTGVLSASRGNIFYNNKDLFGNETSICKDFGYCPQFDTFSKLLTVEEHVKLFNGIKRSKEISQNDIDTILQEIGLYEKKISFPHELSGGQRRKLCIALAFIGDPKYVFLDEPTTGLDPFSRKTIWEFLVQKKENCTIFVTTHYMDEADFLADRKMIISKGKILCLGSSIFLKTKFNMNYTIDIQIKQIHNKKEILLDRLIENYCPGSTTTKHIQKNYFSNSNEIKNGSIYGKENDEEEDYYIISYSLPIKYSKSFSALFTKLNQWIKDPYYSIKGFTLTAPTLEELFIKLQDKSEKNLFLSSSNKEVNIPMEKNEYIDSKILLNQFKKNHSYLKPSFLTQMHQIVKLRLKLFFRNKTFTFIFICFKYLPYTFGITILWIFGCLIFQYLSSSLFKNYEQASRLNVLLNPMISIGIGILIYTVFMSDNVEYVMNVGSTEELKPMNDNYKLYAALLFYWPSFISVFYTELSTFIFKRRYSINSEELRQYISSKPVHDILNNSNMSYLEKSDLITKKLFNLKVPSFSDVLLLENKKFTKYILIMLIAIFLYTFILFLMEKGKIKKFKKHHKISSNNKDETLKWLSDEPEDVQREYRSISYSINTNKNLKKNKTKVKNKMDLLEKIDKMEQQDTNPLLKIFRLKKYYTLNTKEMSNKRKKERKNNPKSHSVEQQQQQRNIKNITNIKYEKGKKIGGSTTTTNGNRNIKENKNNSVVTVSSMNIQNQSNSSIFKTEIEKIDDRITYNGKKRKYTLKIINDVTFGVHRGECLSLLGPNGSGKTTLISIIVGLLHSSEGLVQFDEKNLNDHINHLFDLSIGYCGQHDSLWEELTVYETIQFYLYISGYPSNDINQMTEVLMTSAGIEIYKDKKINEISGGTKRKLSLIISICSFPDYLILDEPSAGMDPFTRRRIWKLITDLKALRQPSTILTTHSTEEAEALSDKMAVLVNGKLVCIDTPKNIKMKHNNMYILEVFTDHPEQFESLFIMEKNIFGLRPEENYELESSLHHQKYFVKMRFENIANVFYWMEYSKDIGLILINNSRLINTKKEFTKYCIIFTNLINSTTTIPIHNP
ncbi:P-loop containing nucleoside triphosphate hydrolase protein [Neocallimastix californiae]|uniref:p-loop containing nucleoside triphosphate hydrolase protein n=1 Tax=Neocallimastix californiae TaxID=1754190 RepID=A0A1Y2AIU5_9FUNG|nr:P-loop containing nucleoside triphosphate hydrolase protein [Neocallimastix californiae]|eukprot:ORY22414.1 P-loop containing nucleoside triphosphate hydrolase protein [Neocallimastix californiae]